MAICVGGVCPVPTTPTAVYAQYAPPGSNGGGPQFTAYPPGRSQAIPVFERPPHPWYLAKPLPDPETLSPETRVLFQVTDLQTESLISPSGQHIRRSEFHNSVDSNGNTYNAYSKAFHISVPLAATSSLIVLLASSLGLSFMLGGRKEHVLSLATPLPESASVRDELKPDSDAVHVIEWEESSVRPSADCTWDSLVQACAGDVMAAAAAIKTQVDADPALNPTSAEAFRRAIDALQPTLIPEPT